MESLNSDHINLILSESSSLLSVFDYQNILEGLLRLLPMSFPYLFTFMQYTLF